METTAENIHERINLKDLKQKKVGLVIFGCGNVGASLIDQIVERRLEIARKRAIDIEILGIVNSTKTLLNHTIDSDWRFCFDTYAKPYELNDVIDAIAQKNFQNLIAIDNTASTEFIENYPTLITSGFHLVSSNKIANTLPWERYKLLQNTLQLHRKHYLYETNVGAGLPLIDTIQLLHLSGDNITRIRGVFSGSLSYLFNTFSEENELFSKLLKRAIEKGYTEPDPREDLCGMDVARKLLILARELDLQNDLEDVFVENLVPKDLRKLTQKSFLHSLPLLDVPFQIKKKNLAPNHVLRYVANLQGNLMDVHGAQLSVNLIPVPKNSVLGQLKSSDSLFEIYTQNYGKNPIVIQGAGAGAVVTARGVFGDILRLSEKF